MRERKSSETIGFAGTGADVELEMVCRGEDGPPVETGRAWLLRYEGREFWMPKAAFNDEGMIYLWAVPILEEKLEKEE